MSAARGVVLSRGGSGVGGHVGVDVVDRQPAELAVAAEGGGDGGRRPAEVAPWLAVEGDLLLPGAGPYCWPTTSPLRAPVAAAYRNSSRAWAIVPSEVPVKSR